MLHMKVSSCARVRIGDYLNSSTCRNDLGLETGAFRDDIDSNVSEKAVPVSVLYERRIVQSEITS